MKNILHLVSGVFFLLWLQAAMPAAAQTFVNLHTFAAANQHHDFTNADGYNCSSGLVLSGDRLYGGCYYGGVYSYGTLFAVNTDGTGFTNLYTFTGGSDGAGPIYVGQLILSGDTLYGTSDGGTPTGDGTIFKINTNGSDFTVLYSFPNNIWTEGSLLLSSNILYGTTYRGGTNGGGTMFSFDLNTSTYKTNYNFPSGANPFAPLIISSNVLYGTTYRGGSNGNGTVFRVNTDGTGFTNLHIFKSAVDGANPHGGSLVLLGNRLYGTASGGGAASGGCIFAVNTDGSDYTNLFTFLNDDDPYGAAPQGGLLLSGNTLYASVLDSTYGDGAVISINTDGSGLTVYYTFSLGDYNSDLGAWTNSEGADPYGQLVISGNTLYGTTYDGTINGSGAVFKLTLSSALALNIAPSGGNYLISWPSSSDANFVLQQNLDLTTTNWTTSNLSVSNDGTNKSVVVIPTSGSGFFRLAKTNSP